MNRVTAFIVLNLALATASAANDREPFQVTFGVRPLVQQQSAVTDRVSFVREAPNGDIFVAGNGASIYTDTGRSTKPMVARIDRKGNFLWQRIYDDLQNYEILAFAAKGDDLFLVARTDARDPSGKMRKTETVTLHRIDGQGDKSNTLGILRGVEIYGTAPVVNQQLERFVLAGIDATGRTYTNVERRDIGLYEISLDGDFQRLPFQNGITGLRLFSHVGGDSFVFLETGTYYSEPKDIMLLDGSGDAKPIIQWFDSQRHPMHVVTTRDRIFLVTTVGIPTETHRIFAYLSSGEPLWNRDFELPEHESVQAVAGLRSGGLVFSSSYEGNPVITTLDSDGELLWERRFRSVKRNANIRSILELSDSWLVLAGSTGPGGGAYVSTDSDAMLTLTDPLGVGLHQYGGCLVDAAEIERLRDELIALTGMEVRREVFMTGAAPVPIKKLPPLNKPIPPDSECGTLSEKQLLIFLQDAVANAEALGLSRASERAKIDVLLRPNGKIETSGFRASGWIRTGKVPSIEIEYGSAANAMDYVAQEVLPYTERAWLVFDRLQKIGRMWVGQDRVTMTDPRSLPFKDVVVLAETLLAHFDRLPAVKQAAFAARFMGKPVVFSPNDQKLHVWSDRWLFVGKDRIEEAFDYALETVPRLDSAIRLQTVSLEAALNLEIHKRPDLDRARHLEALREILDTSQELSAAEVELIRKIGPSLTIGGSDEFGSPMRMTDSNRRIYMTPVAAPSILEEIISHSNKLLAQPRS